MLPFLFRGGRVSLFWLALIAAPACSGSHSTASPSSDETTDASVAPRPTTTSSASAQVFLDGLTERFQSRAELAQETEEDVPTEKARTRFLVPSDAFEFERDGRSLLPRLVESVKVRTRTPVTVRLPDSADREIEVRDDRTHIAIGVTLRDALNVPAETARGYTIHRAAHASGADVLRRVMPDGMEEFLHFAKEPASTEVRYDVALAHDVAGLRLMSGVVEFLDSSGTPRLRMAAPYTVDRDGDKRWATTSVEGCAVDTDPHGPWGRAVTPPGSSRCTIVVSWEPGARYPLLLDPSWTATGNLVFPRTNSAMVVLNDGRALIAGDGSRQPSTSNTLATELYANGTWSLTAQTVMPHANPYTPTSMFLLSTGDPILIGGGGGSSGSSGAAAVEVYSVQNAKWTQIGSYNTTQGDYAAPIGNDRFVAIPGYQSTTIFVSSPGGSGWVSGPQLTQVRAYGAATLMPNGSVLIGGGRDSTGSLLNQTTDIYNPATNLITPGPPMSAPRKHQSQTVIGNYVYIAGGQIANTGGPSYLTGAPGPPTPSVDRYDFTLGIMSGGGTMTQARTYHTATLLPGNKLLVTGGVNVPGADLFDFTSGTWGPAPTTGTQPPPFLGMSSATLQNGTALTAGGTPSVGQPGYALSYVYDPRPPAGSPCQVGKDCASGECVDGVCCSTKCSGTCLACAASQTGQADGTCAPVLAGKDPHDSCDDKGASGCGTNGVCDGAGACQSYAAGVVCRPSANECDVAETCAGGGAACPSNSVQAAGTACTDDNNVCTTDKCNGDAAAPACSHAAGNAGTVCRATAGTCDIQETCTGTSTACPNDTKQANGYVCHGAAGPCDVAETCNGSVVTCPADAIAAAGTTCADDGNPCTKDACDGNSVSCQHPAGNTGTVCRASVGGCDADDLCSGSSTACGADTKLSSSTPCRPSAGACDVPDNCDGVHDNCPADALQPSSYQCRAPSCTGGSATLAANCTGSSTTCPLSVVAACSGTCVGTSCGSCTTDNDCSATGASYCAGGTCNAKKGNGAGCSGPNECTSNSCADGVCCNTACAAGTCDACNLAGSLGTCSPVAAATVCRPAVGECDAAETCNGAMTCPAADVKVPSGTDCTDDGNVCTTDKCNGSSTTCQHAAGNAGSLCRPANGTACDVADYCSGTSTACTDGKQPSGFVCRSAASECDVPESCTGTADACPADATVGNGTACTDDGNLCTTDKCQSGTCAHAAGNAGAVCRSAAGVCDLADTCTGTSTTCLDAKQAAGLSCRAATGVCDQPEVCDGVGNGCPTDTKVGAGTTCADDGNPCTVDKCDGTSSACGHTAGNANTVCRVAAGPCDVDDKCTGTSATCTDGKQASSFVCRSAIDVCDVDDKCDGTSNTCPTDVFKAASTQCRSASCAAGVATVAANCPGTGPSCPSAQTQDCPGSPGMCSGTTCANGCSATNPCSSGNYCAGGVCVTQKAKGESCGATAECGTGFCADGVCCNSACTAGACDSCALPATLGTCSPMPAATVCRPSVGECDTDETCGGSTTCPADATKNGSPCTSDGNVCTTDICSGTTCGHQAAPANTVCRPSGGECDVAETCGGGTTCPADKFRNDGTTCSSDNSPCSDDVCDSGTCAHKPSHAGTTCRSAQSECDAAESCDGTNPNCPADGNLGDGTACTGDGNVCTKDECRAGQCAHPAGNASTVCRDAVGECDVVEKCDGTSTNCPPDRSVANGTACTADTSDCTTDVCQTGVCSHPAGNAGTVCRTATTDCDADEKCDGVTPACPSDGTKADGASCTEDGNLCTKDTCRSGTCTHSNNDGATCADGNTCTSGDACASGQCVGSPVVGCTCVKDADCDDDNACNGVETCVTGACKAATAPDCNDDNDCTVDGCKPASGCTHTALADGATCDDGKYCTVGDACLLGTCKAGLARDCSGVATTACETGECNDAAAKCVVKTSSQACDDGNSCTIQDKCTSGACAGEQKLGCVPCAIASDCEDNNPCTKDFCDDVSRECFYVKYPGCIFVPPPVDGGTGAGGGSPGSGGASSGGTAGNAGGAPNQDSGGSQGSGGDVTTGTDGGVIGGATGAGGTGRGGSSGTGTAGTASGGSTADSGTNGAGTAGAEHERFKKPDYGSCTCRVSAPTSNGQLPGLLALAASLALAGGRRRSRLSASPERREGALASASREQSEPASTLAGRALASASRERSELAGRRAGGEVASASREQSEPACTLAGRALASASRERSEPAGRRAGGEVASASLGGPRPPIKKARR